MLAGLLVIGGLLMLFKPSVLTRSNQNQYRVVERTDIYVDKQGRVVSDQPYDHEVVHLVLAHDERKIYSLCDLSPWISWTRMRAADCDLCGITNALLEETM